MDITKYEVLLHTVDFGSISRAAFNLGYTQSGISHMMKSLEKELGFQILIRGRSGVKLTKEGELFLPKARALVKANLELQQSITNITNLYEGSISIGSYTCITALWLMPVIERFHQDFPNIHIKIVDGTRQDFIDMLEENIINLGFFTYTKTSSPNLKCHPLIDDPFFAVLPANHPLASEKIFKMEYFSQNNFILSSFSTQLDTLQMIKDAGFDIVPSFSTVDMWTAIDMVEHGLGISLIPEMIIKVKKNNTVTLPLEKPLYRKLCMYTPALPHISPATKMFIRYCKGSIPGL